MKADPASAKVLVASDSADDASQIVRGLEREHAKIMASTNADLAVSDFEKFRPDVLVIAFDTIEKAERYSLGLYRHSQIVNQHRHSTVLLCTKDESRSAFELCKKGYFDDYVLYWPQAQDGHRLAMSVWNAARETLGLAHGPSATELMAHARQLSEMDVLLQDQISEGSRLVGTTARTLKEAELAIGAAIDRFSENVTGDEVAGKPAQDRSGFASAVDRLKTDGVSEVFRVTGEKLAPVAAWPQQLKAQVEPHLTGIRKFSKTMRETRWLVLVVDDDPFTHTLIARALGERPYDLMFAEDGAAAFGALRRQRPSLILMDVNLPDMDGVSLTRRLKSAPHLADIPVLMLTGSAVRETLANSMSAGAAGFIVKPFTRDALLGKLEKLLPAQ